MKPIFVAFRFGGWIHVCRHCPGFTWSGYLSASDAADAGRRHVKRSHYMLTTY